MSSVRCVAVDLATFAATAGDWLRREPVLHNVMLTVAQGRVDGDVPAGPDDRWLRVENGDGTLVGAALRTPPRGPLLSGMPREAARALADWFAGDDLGAVFGPSDPCGWFAERYGEVTGTTPVPGMGQRLFRLGGLCPPVGVPGDGRRATRTDRDLLVAWSDAFAREATPDHPHPDPAEPVDARLRHGGLLWLWEDGGEPVSTAWLTVPVAGVVRVGGVYTPPALRGLGYASAVVAAASRHALDSGATDCVLYTDLANPTSNKIYQAVGYRPVADAQEWRFAP